MLTRVVTAACLMPLLLAIYFGPPWLFLVLAMGAGVMAVHETLRLFEAKGLRPHVVPAMGGAILVNVSFHDPSHLPVAASLVIAAALAAGWQLLLRRDTADALESIATTLACTVVPALLLAFQVAVRGVTGTSPASGEPLHGPGLLLVLYAAVFGHDAGAYFTGRYLGRTKLAPRVSPNKTVEGLLGGLASGILLSVLVAAWLDPGLPPPRAAAFGFLLALAAAFGDLTVSALKRSAGVKDAGRLLPGHGGVLDRVAGLLYAAPLLYLLVTASGDPGQPFPGVAMPGSG